MAAILPASPIPEKRCVFLQVVSCFTRRQMCVVGLTLSEQQWCVCFWGGFFCGKCVCWWRGGGHEASGLQRTCDTLYRLDKKWVTLNQLLVFVITQRFVIHTELMVTIKIESVKKCHLCAKNESKWHILCIPEGLNKDFMSHAVLSDTFYSSNSMERVFSQLKRWV